MNQVISPASAEAASVLTTTLIFGVILGVTSLALLEMGSFRMRSAYGREQWMEAYYHAENALNWAAQKVADADTGGNSAPFLGHYTLSGSTLTLPYMTEMRADPNSLLNDVWLSISNHPSHLENLYIIRSSDKVGTKVRTI